MANFTQDFVIATEKTCKASWSCIPDGEAFFCAFCGHDFIPGDEYRMVYTNDLSGYGGNPLTCGGCWVANDGYEGSRKAWQEKC